MKKRVTLKMGVKVTLRRPPLSSVEMLSDKGEHEGWWPGSARSSRTKTQTPGGGGEQGLLCALLDQQPSGQDASPVHMPFA